MYKWIEEKLTTESSPLRYLFYPQKNNKSATNKNNGPFRLVIAAEQMLCNKLCLNIRHYLGTDDITIYTITSLEELTSVERSDWEDCNLAILHHPFIQPDIYSILNIVPESMSTCIIADPRVSYRDYLAAPMFKERVQSIYTSNDSDMAQLIQMIYDVASFQLESK